MFVRMLRGLKTRDPLTKLFIPDEGCEVVDHPYWHRRVRDGDAEIIAPVTTVKDIEL
jgi:hypothetical protein